MHDDIVAQYAFADVGQDVSPLEAVPPEFFVPL